MCVPRRKLQRVKAPAQLLQLPGQQEDVKVLGAQRDHRGGRRAKHKQTGHMAYAGNK